MTYTALQQTIGAYYTGVPGSRKCLTPKNHELSPPVYFELQTSLKEDCFCVRENEFITVGLGYTLILILYNIHL